jgi:Fe-S-cluster-containing hydrogenase component 2
VKYLYVYPELCTGCRVCALACSLKKNGVCNPKHAAIYVARDEFERWEYPIVCLQCEDPVCVEVCPQNAYTIEDGIVVHDEERCIGCRLCATLCPNAAINTMGTKVLKCDLCGGDPECVKFCTTEAIKYMEETAELEERRHELVHRLRSATD